MGSVNFITHADVLQLIAKRTAEDCIIFLSGPTSRKTPLSLLRMKDVIAVNGSVQYLLNNNVKPFLYLLTDVRFLHRRREDFYNFSRNSQFTIVNLDVYEQASVDEQKYIEENCLIIRSFYRREKGGISEFVLDGITGYHLAEPMSSDSIINDINRALADKERHQIAEKAKSLVFSKYSWENVAQRFEEQMKSWFDK